jgi:hypothetical protein
MSWSLVVSGSPYQQQQQQQQKFCDFTFVFKSKKHQQLSFICYICWLIDL